MRGWWGCPQLRDYLTRPPRTRRDASLPKRGPSSSTNRSTLSRKGVARSSFSARIERALSHRARSASEEGWPGRSLLTLLRPRVARAKRTAPPSPASPPSPIRTLFSALPDTPLQSSPNPSETDPYPSTPLSSGPRNGTYPAKFHRPGSAGH